MDPTLSEPTPGRSNFVLHAADRKGRHKHAVTLWLVVLGVLALAASNAFADTVTLENGDRLTGTIVKSDGKELSLKTDNEGIVTVKWSVVRQITSTAPLFVVTSQGTTVAGPVTTEDGDLVVTPAIGAQQRVPLASVTALRSESEERAYERSQSPGLLESWEVTSAFGLALARGNNHTTNLNFGFTAARTTPHDKLAAYMTSVYSSSGLVVAPGVTAGVTADDIRGGARYQHDIRDRAFAYASADFEHNALQFLDVRSILGLGAGYHVIKETDVTLDLFAGGNYTRETYSIGIVRSVAALTVGDTLLYQLSKNNIINESFDFYPELTHLGQYRFAFDMSINTKIKAWLGWQSTISDRYISDPIPGTVANDLIFSTGINLTFTH